MLYIFVNEKHDKVLHATYNEDDAKLFCKGKYVVFSVRYWDDIEVYEVIDNDL